MTNKNTLSFWLNVTLQGMRTRSQRRGLPPPEINCKQCLTAWLEKNNLSELWQRFVDSDYDKWLKPSIDRLDNSKHYTESNMRLVTWRENLGAWHNSDEGREHGRRAALKLAANRHHCRNGHEYVDGSYFRSKDGQRRCIACWENKNNLRRLSRRKTKDLPPRPMWLDFRGQKLKASQIARLLKVSETTIMRRFKRGYPLDMEKQSHKRIKR